MMNTQLLSLAAGTVRGAVANYFFVKTGIDVTCPTHVYAQLNYRCNSKCRMCNEWRIKDDELPAAVWNRALTDLKSLNPAIKLSFAGGEIFMKPDLFEILEHCHEQNIIFGITTNGILLNGGNIERLMALNPFNINISIDSLDRGIYAYIRGVNSLDKVKRNVDQVMRYKEQTVARTSINLKSVVTKENVHCLDEIAEYAMAMRFAGVTFQPIIETTTECKEMMNVDNSQLTAMIDKLIAMKHNGFNIMNSENNIRSWPSHFGKNTASRTGCNVPLNNLYMLPNGNIQLCDYIYESVGNFVDDDIATILTRKETKTLKRDLVDCRKICTYCVQRTMKDYALLAYKYMRQ